MWQRCVEKSKLLHDFINDIRKSKSSRKSREFGKPLNDRLEKFKEGLTTWSG